MVTVVALLIGGAVGWYCDPISKRACDLAVIFDRRMMAIVGALGLASIAWAIGNKWVLFAWLWIGIVGIVLSFVDLQHHRLPDVFTVPSYAVVALLLLVPTLATGQWDAYLRGLIGAVVLLVGYFVLALINPQGMGLGDVKLAGVLGLALGYLGLSFVFVGFLAAFVIGAVVGLALMAAGKAGRKTAIPFGPFMFIGAVVALYVTGPFISVALPR